MRDMHDVIKERGRDSDRDDRRRSESRSRDRNRNVTAADRDRYIERDRDISDRNDKKRNRSRSRSDEYYSSSWGRTCDDGKHRSSRWDRNTPDDDTDFQHHSLPPNQGKWLSDWTCPSCSCLNYSRREVCRRCARSRVEEHGGSGKHGDDFPDNAVFTPTPSTFLVARGLHASLTEEEISETFRQFAAVKNVTLLRDGVTLLSRGLAFIELHTIEHTVHACKTAALIGLKMCGLNVNVHYANIKFMREQLESARQAAVYHKFAEQRYEAYRLSQSAAHVIPEPFQPSVDYLSPGVIPPQANTAPIFQTDWPPIFEHAGGAYLFQAQSGFFYEPLSAFYFCPKTRLYYSCKDSCYYRHDSTISSTECPFRRFEHPHATASLPSTIDTDSSVSSSLNLVDSVAPTVSQTESLLREPVIISLAGGSGSSSASAGKAKTKGLVAPSRKIMEENIAKWGAISKDEPEDEPIDETITFENSSASANTAAFDGPDTPLTRNSITTTAGATTLSDQVVSPSAGIAALCMICRRQFTSFEMLTRHEKESKLHAENLVKQQIRTAGAGATRSSENTETNNPMLDAADITTPTEAIGVLAGIQSHLPSSTYRDRASERRSMHGQSGIPLAHADSTHHRGNHGRPPPVPLVPVPSEQAQSLISAESNPGNIMLRAMGWTQGKGLGKHEEGIADPIRVKQQSSLAPHAGIGLSDHTIPKIIYRAGDEQYKQSLVAASRARFELLDK